MSKILAYCSVLLIGLSITNQRPAVPFAQQLPQQTPTSPSVPIYAFDDPYECRDRFGKYCFVTTYRKIPENRHVSWEYPRRLKVQYHREVLEWGLCTKQCDDEIAVLPRYDRALLIGREFSASNFTLKYPEYYFPERIYMDAFYGDLMKVCVNYRMAVMYNVTGFPDLENCITSHYTPWQFIDWFTCAFYVILFVSIVGFGMSNILDICGDYVFRGFLLIRVASIRLNWENLVKIVPENRISEIRCIQNLRFLLVILAIAFNCFMMMIGLPWENSEKIEKLLSNSLLINVLSCMFWIIPLILTLDGFLAISHFMNYRDKSEEVKPRYFLVHFFCRLIDTHPLYLVMLVYTTIMDSIWSDKPTVGRYLMMTREARFCRQNIWYNVFMINNFRWTQELCYAPGWYNAAYAQMYIIGTQLLCSAVKYPKTEKYIRNLLPLMLVLAPGIGTWMIPSTPLPPLQLNDIHTTFMYQTWYRCIHLPSYMSMGSFVAGMLAGYYNHKLKNGDFTVYDGKLYKWVSRLAFPLFLFTACFPFAFYKLNLNRPGFITSFYAILFSNSGGIFLAYCLLRKFRNIPRFLKRGLGTVLLIIPCRLTACLYLVHPLVIRWFLSLEDPRAGFQLINYPILFGKVFVITFLFAFMMYMVVERPIRHLLRATVFKQHVINEGKLAQDEITLRADMLEMGEMPQQVVIVEIGEENVQGEARF